MRDKQFPKLKFFDIMKTLLSTLTPEGNLGSIFPFREIGVITRRYQVTFCSKLEQKPQGWNVDYQATCCSKLEPEGSTGGFTGILIILLSWI